MNKRIFSSLIAVLLLTLCTSEIYAQDKLYDHVSLENPPTYPGGIKAFYDFLGSNVKYPKLAVDSNIQGITYVTFTIEKDGSLKDIKTEGRKLGYGLDEEAIRVLKLSKNWNPGMIAGQAVRVKYAIPIKFKIPVKSTL